MFELAVNEILEKQKARHDFEIGRDTNGTDSSTQMETGWMDDCWWKQVKVMWAHDEETTSERREIYRDEKNKRERAMDIIGFWAPQLVLLRQICCKDDIIIQRQMKMIIQQERGQRRPIISTKWNF